LTEHDEDDGKELMNKVLRTGLEEFNGDVDVRAEPADLGSDAKENEERQRCFRE
jgi:hypothetical protein